MKTENITIRSNVDTKAKLEQLAKYCKCTQTEVLEVLIELGYHAAWIQAKMPESCTPDKWSHEQEYFIELITRIFDELYPPTYEL